MIHLQKSRSCVCVWWAHANVAPFLLCALELRFSHIRRCILWPYFVRLVFFSFSIPKCAVLFFHVNSYTFQYLFIHGSFVYFSFDYQPTLARRLTETHSHTHTQTIFNSHVVAYARKLSSTKFSGPFYSIFQLNK